MDLDRVGNVGRQRAGEDRGPITRWLASATSGRVARGDRGTARDVRVDVGRELLVAAVEERAGGEALVAIGDVDRQDAADVGVVDGDPLASSTGSGRGDARPGRRDGRRGPAAPASTPAAAL